MLSRITPFFIAIAFLIIIAQSWGEITMWWIVPVFLVLGFLLGKITCSHHLKKFGFWITIILFSLLNTLHSMIDGVSLIHSASASGWAVILLHEIIRQPLLYVIIWGLLMPFTISKSAKGFWAFVAVTGTWILGLYLGRWFGAGLETMEWLHPYLAGSMFILAGDMIHHVWDTYAHNHR